MPTESQRKKPVLENNSPAHSDMSMQERMAKLEGAFAHAFEGVRHGQNITLGAVGLAFAIITGLLVYMHRKIDNLPNEFQNITQTLSSAITASKQQQPQVILMQAAPPAQTPPAQAPPAQTPPTPGNP
jgi:hypothetical protein